MARNRTVTERTGMALDTSSYHDAARALRKSRGITNKEMRKRLRAAGEIVASEARKIAGEHSESIPPSVKVRVAGATVAVIAGGEQAPLAGLFELGNKGKGKSQAASRRGVFRHPVFGDRENWVDQARYPFIRPAADVTLPAAQREIVQVLDECSRVIVTGYHGSSRG